MQEALTDDERQLVLVFMHQAWVRAKDLDDGPDNAAECENIIRKLSGVDTKVICERTYASGATT